MSKEKSKCCGAELEQPDCAEDAKSIFSCSMCNKFVRYVEEKDYAKDAEEGDKEYAIGDKIPELKKEEVLGEQEFYFVAYNYIKGSPRISLSPAYTTLEDAKKYVDTMGGENKKIFKVKVKQSELNN